MEQNGYEPAFKNAKFWTNENHWDGQQNQTLEKASFLSENILPMQESGQLHFIKDLKVIFLKIRTGF
jgi:hypothetical protein